MWFGASWAENDKKTKGLAPPGQRISREQKVWRLLGRKCKENKWFGTSWAENVKKTNGFASPGQTMI